MNAHEIKMALAGRAESVASYLLPHGKKCGQEWRAGSVDGEEGQSLGVRIAGGKAGVWSDFSTGEKGDLIVVPDSATHWFDMGPAPRFVAIRFFTEADGWVGHFTGSDIAKRFPRYE